MWVIRNHVRVFFIAITFTQLPAEYRLSGCMGCPLKSEHLGKEFASYKTYLLSLQSSFILLLFSRCSIPMRFNNENKGERLRRGPKKMIEQ